MSHAEIALLLKSEISRIARRAIKAETLDFKNASTQYRTHIAALRRRIYSLERELKRVRQRAGAIQTGTDKSATPPNVRRRFSAARLAATRRMLGLSAAAFGALIGVTGQSIYKWEAGEARPRAKQLEAMASIRGIGKREAAARLQAAKW